MFVTWLNPKNLKRCVHTDELLPVCNAGLILNSYFYGLNKHLDFLLCLNSIYILYLSVLIFTVYSLVYVILMWYVVLHVISLILLMVYSSYDASVCICVCAPEKGRVDLIVTFVFHMRRMRWRLCGRRWRTCFSQTLRPKLAMPSYSCSELLFMAR